MNKKNKLVKLVFGLLWLLPLLPLLPYVAYASSAGFGGIASNINEPVSTMTGIIHVACFIIGGAFLFTALIKYFEHRRSPLMVPISTVVFLIVAGVILIVLPLFSMYTGGLSGYSPAQ